jgi:hypothetical protein
LQNNVDSARLVWLDSFVAAAAHGNYERAGREISRAPTTIKRQIEKLELWLRLLLVASDDPLIFTPEALDFLPTAHAVLKQIDQAHLRTRLSYIRVQADGSVTEECDKIGPHRAHEIGQLMIASRAATGSIYVPPPPVSPDDIDMSFFTGKA